MDNEKNHDSPKLKFNESGYVPPVLDHDYLSHINRIKSGDDCILFGKSFGFMIFDQFDLNGQHVLHHAVMNSKESVFIFILTHGECTTPEEIVSKVSQNQKSVLKIDPCILSKCTDGSAPLHVTCKFGNLKMTEILLNIGVPIEIRDSNLKTPLIVATYCQNIETVIYLISKGANILAEDKELDNCLHWAAYCGINDKFKLGNEDLMNLFLTFGLDINKPDEFMQVLTAVHMACMCGNINAVELCLNHDKKGRTPLELAVTKNFTDAAKKISAHSNRFNKKNAWEQISRLFIECLITLGQVLMH
ncbi:hypothetical protein MXB_709 [Myxobolus squamalis]|nr:hypothetical protein MXB_709 [Myxobolus squamalis]